jgi:pimeloyl-ACP methyl ester carboxylesterase
LLKEIGMPTRAELIAGYLQRVVADPGEPATLLESSLGAGREMPATERVMTEAALETYNLLRQGREVEADQLYHVEAIILPMYRPVIDVIGDTFEDPGPRWAALYANKGKIEDAIRAIGRVEIPNHPFLPYAGTGFIVGPDLLLTNRHVAELFVGGLGLRNLTFLPGRTGTVNLRREILPSTGIALQVERALMIHPYWDAALLQVSGLPAERAPLRLAASEPSQLKKRSVAVVGYPAFDPNSDADLQYRIFRNKFQCKRLQPGEIMEYRPVDSFDHTVEAIAHDCSTLGGNSGSAVIDVETGVVLALHFGGAYLVANYAVPAWELARDRRVADLGVSFIGTAAAGDSPSASFWAALDGALTESPATAPSAPPDALLAADWYERTTERDIASAMVRDPENTLARLTEVLGASQALRLANPAAVNQRIVSAIAANPARGASMLRGLAGTTKAETAMASVLAAPITEGVTDLILPDPDPNLPEIVYLHGIMGGHLDQPGFFKGRVWMNSALFFVGDLAGRLTLASDGDSEGDGKPQLVPDGMLQVIYQLAAFKWRMARFAVHQFSYDWRKGIAFLADRFQDFLLAKARERPGRRFAVVAHSMGGLVACLYASRHGEWKDLIQRAVFIGAPLGGSYAPMDAVTGGYSLLQKLAQVSFQNDLDQLRRMAATMPGLLDMMPNPDLFPDAEALYTQSVWPHGIVPAQRWLDQSRFLKRTILQSPLLDRTTLLVSLSQPTLTSAEIRDGAVGAGRRNGAGDGTVPGRALVPNGLPAFAVTGEHAFLPDQTSVIQAVASLLQTGSTNLTPVKSADVTAALPEAAPAAFTEAALGEGLAGIRSRFQKGALTRDDIRWLLSNDTSKLPEN